MKYAYIASAVLLLAACGGPDIPPPPTTSTPPPVAGDPCYGLSSVLMQPDAKVTPEVRAQIDACIEWRKTQP